MSTWPSIKANRLLSILKQKGWVETRKKGSHRFLRHPLTNKTFLFAFHETEEIGPKMVSKVAKDVGLKPEDL